VAGSSKKIDRRSGRPFDAARDLELQPGTALALDPGAAASRTTRSMMAVGRPVGVEHRALGRDARCSG
jgi:hypothetical protein